MEREDTTAHQPQVKNEPIPSSRLCARRLNGVSSVWSHCSHGSRTPRGQRDCVGNLRSEGAKTPGEFGLKFCLSLFLNM